MNDKIVYENRNWVILSDENGFCLSLKSNPLPFKVSKSLKISYLFENLTYHNGGSERVVLDHDGSKSTVVKPDIGDELFNKLIELSEKGVEKIHDKEAARA